MQILKISILALLFLFTSCMDEGEDSMISLMEYQDGQRNIQKVISGTWYTNNIISLDNNQIIIE